MKSNGHVFGARVPVSACALLLCLWVAACSQGDPPPPPANFSRPEDVAFACMRVSPTEVTPVALDECHDRDTTGDVVLHALVTQTATGEVAAVEMVANRTSIGTQPGRVIDSRLDIPGYTFVDVGAVPSDIAVPRYDDHPKWTYVASYAAREISVFDTAAFRPLGVQRRARLGRVSDLGGRPEELMFDPRPDERYLYASLPDAGAIVRLEICRDADACELGLPIAKQTLPLTVPDSVLALPETPGLEGGEPYSSDGVCKTDCDDKGCLDFAYAPPTPADPPVWPAARVLDPDVGARPRALALDLSACPDPADDACEPVLLVADENLPVVHRVKLGDSLSLLEPLATRVPVADVVATPLVPVAPGSDELTSYVYAIDATDGSVMVLQDGQILTVSDTPNERRDRVGFSLMEDGVRAVSLEVMTPGFPATNEEFPCLLTLAESLRPDVVESTPTRLRGVFVAVGATDGRVRVIDIHDLDMAAKLAGVEPEGENVGCTRDCPFFVKRHRPRFVNALQGIDPVRVAADGTAKDFAITSELLRFSYLRGTVQFEVRSDGTTRDIELPTVSCVPCGELSMVDVFPRLPTITTTTSSSNTSGDGDGAEMDKRLQGAGSLDGTSDPAEAMDAGVADGGTSEPVADEEDLVDDTCPDGTARVCALGDPWAASQDQWLLQLEGEIPGSGSRRGRLLEADGDEARWAVDGDACAVGVVAGDQLVIRGVPDVATRAELDEDCLAYVKLMEDATNGRRLGFEILEARQDVLRVREEAVEPISGLPNRLSDLVKRCFPPLGDGEVDASVAIAYEVRALGQFIAQGARLGYVHDVTAVDGECIDAAARMSGTRRTARVPICDVLAPVQGEDGEVEVAAAADDPCIFDNGHIALRMQVEDIGDLPRGDTILLNLSTLPPSDHIIFEANDVAGVSQAGVLPSELRYSGADVRLYMVDPQARGLVPITLERFPGALQSTASHLN